MKLLVLLSLPFFTVLLIVYLVIQIDREEKQNLALKQYVEQSRQMCIDWDKFNLQQ